MTSLETLDHIKLPDLSFKSNSKPSLIEIANYIDVAKKMLFDGTISHSLKKIHKENLNLFVREQQKKLMPSSGHYYAEDLSYSKKKHLEHVIPQNVIFTAYLTDYISAEKLLQMPLCFINDTDKHILEHEWQTVGKWKFPFLRYKLAGFNKKIYNTKGESIDVDLWTIEDHFRMLGVDKMVKDVNI
jgi:hydroxymethylpyrimidine pyrophosphatase-like HAD family hydrolase